jgi:membrane-associated protease RseP (regulator of RpoE activity)
MHCNCDNLAEIELGFRIALMHRMQFVIKQYASIFANVAVIAASVVVIRVAGQVSEYQQLAPTTCPPVVIGALTSDVTKPPPIPHDMDSVEIPLAAPPSDYGITKVNDRYYKISRASFEAALANPMQLAQQARIVPSLLDGRPSGFKLYAIRPHSGWVQLGLQNGDRIISINGFELTSPDKCLEVYTRLRTAASFEVLLGRKHQEITITYELV